MAKNPTSIALAVAALLLTGNANAIGTGAAPRAWSAFAYSHLPVLGHEAAWASDYGIVSGRCNAALVGAVVAEADGSDSHTPLIASLHGPILGDPPALDATDRGCMGHALELAPSFFAVYWINPETHGSFVLTPMRRLTLHGNQCRVFSAQATVEGEAQIQRATACRLGPGEWYLI